MAPFWLVFLASEEYVYIFGGFVASTYIDLYSGYTTVHYGVYTVYATNIRPFSPVYSSMQNGVPSCGLHPVVIFSANLLDVNDVLNDGTSPMKAWNIK